MQRGYKQKLDRGGPSHGLTPARVAQLEAVGFAWEATAQVTQCPVPSCAKPAVLQPLSLERERC